MIFIALDKIQAHVYLIGFREGIFVSDMESENLGIYTKRRFSLPLICSYYQVKLQQGLSTLSEQCLLNQH